MNRNDGNLDIAADLRTAFDDSFAERPVGLVDPPLAFLKITAGGQSYLVELGEVSGIFADAAISRFPGAARGLVGLAGIQGELVPVFSLALLLDLASEARSRWTILHGSSDKAGFCFEALEGYEHLDRSAVVPAEAGDGPRHVRATGCISGERHPILSLETLMKELNSAAGAVASRGSELK